MEVLPQKGSKRIAKKRKPNVNPHVLNLADKLGKLLALSNTE